MLRYKVVRAGFMTVIAFALTWGFFAFFPPKPIPPDPYAEIQRCSYWKTMVPTLTLEQQDEVECYWKTFTFATPIGAPR